MMNASTSVLFLVTQLCPTLCDAMDCSPLSMGILQARILEWVAMPSSRGSSWPRDRTHISYVHPHWQVSSLPIAPPGKLLRPWSSLLNLLPQKSAEGREPCLGLERESRFDSNKLLEKKQPPEFSSTSFFLNVLLNIRKTGFKGLFFFWQHIFLES